MKIGKYTKILVSEVVRKMCNKFFVTGTKLEEIYHNKLNFQFFKHQKSNQLMRDICKKKSIKIGDYACAGKIIN